MTDTEQIGKIKFSDEAISMIVHSASLGVQGVVSFTGGLTEGFQNVLKKKNYGKGIKIEITEDQATVDIHLIVEFGYRIPDIATNIQSQVKQDVQAMTGLNVSAVNIHIEGIVFPES